VEFSKVLEKVISHKSMLENTLKDYDDNTAKIDRYKLDLNVINEQYRLTELGYEYLERLIHVESTKFIKRLQDLITYGLKAIFYDRPDYACDIRVNDNSTATIHLIQEDDESGLIIDPEVRNCGGGIRTVVGIIIQIFFIFHYNAEHIIFVDEGFSQVSSKYIPYLMAFLEELAEKKDLIVVLITHDDRLVPYAKRVYEITNHNSELITDNTDNTDKSA
jgi:DNA repair exonuclease SbcCD ATPase subunit